MWVVGIDEAGYGPNLGPLLQAAVALRLPDDDPAGWDTLKPIVRQARGKDDGRLLIDDSKKVYTRGGIAALERGEKGELQRQAQRMQACLAHFKRLTEPRRKRPLCAPPTDGAPRPPS